MHSCKSCGAWCVQAGKQPQRQAEFFARTPEGTSFSARSFADLHLSRPLLRACEALGYTHPTPIQVCFDLRRA